MPTRRAFHKWSSQDREILCLLKLRHSRKVIAPIFNHLLSTKLAQEGFQNGMTAPSLDAQWQEMKTGGGGYEIYTRISNLSENEVKTQYKSHLSQINLAIQTLGSQVRSSLKTTRPRNRAQQKSSSRKKNRHANHIQESEPSDASIEPETRLDQVRPQLQQFLHHSPYFASKEGTNSNNDNSDLVVSLDSADTVAPTPRIQRDINGLQAKARPLLLFRSSETPHVFRSRRYADRNKPVRPPEKFNTKGYKDEARPHLQRDRSYLSPFISFATSARNAIGRIEIETSEFLEAKRFFVVFAYNDMEVAATRDFGPESGPHPVGALFSKTELSDLPKGYKGSGEWLAYGHISCDPLVVLDAVQAVSLAKAIRRFATGDLAALLVIKECLKELPAKWKEAVSYNILRGYCASKLPKVGSPAYFEMIQLVTGKNATPSTDIINLSRLSVADDMSEDEQDDEISPPHQYQMPSQDSSNLAKSAPAEAPSNVRSEPPERVKAVIKNLNFLATRNVTKEIPPRIVEPTPFWSSSPSEDINSISQRPHPSPKQVRPMPLEEIVNIDDIEDDDDWDLVDDDLERSFIDSLPSASKGARKYQPAANVHTRDDSHEEIDDHIVQSIEKESGYNDENTYSRGGFLRGLTRHAASISPPTQDTPTKVPRILNSQRSGLARVISRHGRGGNMMTTKLSTNDLNSKMWPGTNVRTKVPVIVRKKIVDY